ncbi:MAG: alpha/beta fold hydrolase, partial [bacterium]|nr:alpha/beta fold hydrolase [bacterium]
AILLIHGFVDLPLAWQRQADVLAQKGYYVLVPQINHEYPNTWMPMLEAHLSHLCKTYPHVELWGHSMGGALALALAQKKFPLKRVVLWAPFLAPYLTRPLTTILYFFHRLVLFGPRTFTFFPSHRRAKGEPTACYYVNCTLPIQTFATLLQTQYLAIAAKQKAQLLFVLSHRERVVSNSAILKRFKDETILWAAHPSSEHQLTNTSDWLKNLNRVFRIKNDETRPSL